MCINWDTKFGLPLEYDDLKFFFLADIEHNPFIDNLTPNYFDCNNYKYIFLILEISVLPLQLHVLNSMCVCPWYLSKCRSIYTDSSSYTCQP